MSERELTDAERIEQIGWEIKAEEAQATTYLCEAKVYEIDQRAGISDFGLVAANYAAAERCNSRIARLRFELAGLTRAAA